jgi:hypothetical protein
MPRSEPLPARTVRPPPHSHLLPALAFAPSVASARGHTLLTSSGEVVVRSMVHRALNPDKSIRAVLTDLAVADDRIEQTPADASWCEARSRLPEALWAELLQHSVRRLEGLTAGQFLYKQRPVFLIDGSTLSMPDTPELVEQFGYSGSKHGLSRFPLGRITAVSAGGHRGTSCRKRERRRGRRRCGSGHPAL